MSELSSLWQFSCIECKQVGLVTENTDVSPEWMRENAHNFYPMTWTGLTQRSARHARMQKKIGKIASQQVLENKTKWLYIIRTSIEIPVSGV